MKIIAEIKRCAMNLALFPHSNNRTGGFMTDLSAIAALIYDAADELADENDRAEARERNRAVDPLVERMAENRQRMNPSLVVRMEAGEGDAMMNVPDGWKMVPVEPTEEMVAACVTTVGKNTRKKWYRAMLSAAPTPPAQEPEPSAMCKGVNCNAINGTGHSPECMSEHEKTVHLGAGNRHPTARYRGYKGEPCDAGASDDEIAAWAEGNMAKEPVSMGPVGYLWRDKRRDWSYCENKPDFPDQIMAVYSAEQLVILQAKLDAWENGTASECARAAIKAAHDLQAKLEQASNSQLRSRKVGHSRACSRARNNKYNDNRSE